MTTDEIKQSASEMRAPRGVRIAALSVLGVSLAGAAYLVVVRGEAIMVDLSGLAGKVWCF